MNSLSEPVIVRDRLSSGTDCFPGDENTSFLFSSFLVFCKPRVPAKVTLLVETLRTFHLMCYTPTMSYLSFMGRNEN